MALRMKLVTIAALAALSLSLSVAPGAATAEENARGEVLFDLCVQCHGSAGQGMQLSMAPAIAGLGEWYVARQLKNFKNGLRGLHPDDRGGLRMYPMSLSLRSDEDIQAVAAYVASLPRPYPPATIEGGDPAKGATSYATCAACHGPDGAGNEKMNAPQLSGGSDWYLVDSLQKFKAGIRGGNAENTNAVMMRGMSMSLADDQAIRDVVAHIMTLGKE